MELNKFHLKAQNDDIFESSNMKSAAKWEF